MMATRLPFLGGAMLPLLALLHCSTQESARGAGEDSGVGGTTAVGSGGGGTAGSGGPVIPPPSEDEERERGAFRAPVASGKYLWSANPESNRVALVDSSVLEVRLLQGRFAPTHLASVPSAEGGAAAIVVNVLSQDASLFEVDAERNLTTRVSPLHADANRWAVSADGRWAVAWMDAATVQTPDPTDGFQDLSVLELGTGESYPISVGYRPSQVRFNADASQLLVVAEPGVSVIDLSVTPPENVSLIQLEEDALADANARDVSITPEGDYALVGAQNQNQVRLVSLKDGTTSVLELSAHPTDLDLSQDGEHAVAVLRNSSELVILDTSSPAEGLRIQSTLQIPGETFGSVVLSPDARTALLYTNAIANDRLTIVDLSDADAPSHRTVSVKSPISTLQIAPDGEHAIVLMTPPPGSQKAGAFAIVPTRAERSPKIVGTDAPPVLVGLSTSVPTHHALVATHDPENKTQGAFLLSLPSLQVDPQPLASPPLSVGVVADTNKAYIAQEHPEGRITFISLDTSGVRTLTGFELADKVTE